jgi:hypothetical protein
MHEDGSAEAGVEQIRNHLETVKIYIDRIEKTSPMHTTGAALYALGAVQNEYVLFREMEGRRDDELVPKTEAPIHLREWEHLYSAQAKLNPGSSRQ